MGGDAQNLIGVSQSPVGLCRRVHVDSENFIQIHPQLFFELNRLTFTQRGAH